MTAERPPRRRIIPVTTPAPVVGLRSWGLDITGRWSSGARASIITVIIIRMTSRSSRTTSRCEPLHMETLLRPPLPSPRSAEPRSRPTASCAAPAMSTSSSSRLGPDPPPSPCIRVSLLTMAVAAPWTSKYNCSTAWETRSPAPPRRTALRPASVRP